MSTKAEFQEQIEKVRSSKPDWASFNEISLDEEIAAGVRESVAVSKWIKILTKDQK